MENTGIRKTLQPLDDKGAKMKPLLTCLLVGCLVSPVCAQERNWTLEEFVRKLQDGQPWTKEKAEAQLGVKLTKVSSAVNRASGQFVYGEGLIISAISYDVWEEIDEKRGWRANEMRSVRIWFDDKSSCFTQERIKKSYPGGKFTGLNIHPGGSDDYAINLGWGVVSFEFGDKKKWECLTGIHIGINRVIHINE
jgi:hypothetical protein